MASLDGFPELPPPLGTETAPVEADRCVDCSGPYARVPGVVAVESSFEWRGESGGRR